MEKQEHEQRKHPNYILVWAWLFVLTIIEVAAASTSMPRRVLIPTLIALAIWKALLVALFFMHLRFEPKRLIMIVLAPLPLAVILVMAVLQEYGP
jgi:cytochrome c oxidase subunit 4